MGPELKYAGYDNLIINGKSREPVYLYINDDEIKIRKANFLWGKDIYETENLLLKEIGDEYIKIACIEPAGENRVRGSAIIMDTSKAACGSGVGCVMGDKKLKAIVVRGHGKIKVAHTKKFMQVIAKCYKQCQEEPSAKIMRKAPFNKYTDSNLENWDNAIVVKNGQDDYWEKEKRNRLMNHTTGIPSMQKRVGACYLYPIGCMPFLKIKKGKYKDVQGEGFWVNTIWGHACRFDISDPESVIKAWLLTNKLGLDGDYVAAGLSWILNYMKKES